MANPISIGISLCLLGEQVRYNGGHKADHYITETLGKFFNFVGFCPEVQSGLPTPREVMRLEGDLQAPRLVTRYTRIDLTGQVLAWCRNKVEEPELSELCGFIFKKRSPSCGPSRVKVFNPGLPARSGRGLFANVVARHFPLVPMTDEERLDSMAIRENFIERVFACRRWREFLQEEPSIGNLVEFHTAHKLLVMSHSPTHYREMGKLVAHGNNRPWDELLNHYQKLFMEALSLHATVSKNVNVLQHIAGYFKKQLSPIKKKELLDIIDRYRGHQVPLSAPLTLLMHYTDKYDQNYLKKQIYLHPLPAELMTSNHG